MEADFTYYRRRAAEELAAATVAANPTVRDVHLELARRYNHRLEALAEESRTGQLHLVHAA